jgi:hypothetical protein
MAVFIGRKKEGNCVLKSGLRLRFCSCDCDGAVCWCMGVYRNMPKKMPKIASVLGFCFCLLLCIALVV